jgi:hypothetical protein
MRRLVLVAIAVVAALVAAEWLFEPLGTERQRALLERKLSDALGLQVSIRGDLHLELLRGLRLVATDVVVANLPERSSPHLVEIGEVDLDLSALRLLRGIVEVNALYLLDTELHVEPDAEGRFGLAADVEALTEEPQRDPVALRVHELELERLQVFYTPRPGEPVVSARFARLSLRAEPLEGPLEVAAEGELDGGPFDLEARLGSLDELLEPTGPYPLRVEGRVLELELEVEGTVDEPRSLGGLDVAVSGSVPDLTVLSRGLDRDLPSTGPIRFSTRVTNAKGPFALADMRIATEQAEPIRAVLTGSIADVRELRGIDVTLDLNAEGAGLLPWPAERRLETFLSLEADLVASDEDGTLGVEGELHASGRDDSIAIDLVGGQDDVSGFREIDVRAGLRSSDLRVLARAAGLQQPLPAIGPVVARGRIRDRDGKLGVDDLDVRIGQRDDSWLELRGAIRDVVGQAGVTLEATFGAADLHHAQAFTERELPDIGPIRGTATLSDGDGSLGVERFTVKGGVPKKLHVELAGKFDDVRETDEITVDARLSARDLSLVGELFDADLPDIGPVEFEGRVTGSNERLVSKGSARLDQTTLKGEWSASFATGDRPRVWARLASPRIRLRDVGIEPRDVTPDRPRRAAQARDGFSAQDPLPVEQLRVVDLDVELQAERITGREGFEAHDVKFGVGLEDGELVVRDFDADWRGGRLDSQLRVDSSTPDPVVALNFEATGLEVARLVSQFEREPVQAGFVDLSLGLSAEGRTLADFRSSLDGTAWLVIRDGVATSRYAREFLRTLVRVSVPSLRVGEAVSVGCTVVDFGIEAGVATAETLVLASRDATIRGRGTVDIGRGLYDLRLEPRPHDPGLLSLAVAVDVTGPLNAPDFRPVRRTLATSAAQAVVSNLMRPKRFITRTLRGTPTRRGHEDFCAEARGGRPELRPIVAQEDWPTYAAP